MDYNQTIKYIHSVSNYFCKPGLERIKQLCRFLGNPQDKLKFVHVAGTNGKGSFCSIISSILMEAGFNVGTYTSPYILKFNERISINGEMIPDNDLVNICEYVKSFCDKMDDKPTEFELITAIAFEYFYRKKCDIVVLECGLGGRYDATNIINTSVLSVITGIDFDHQNFLGNTIEEIANEKAGIIKRNIPCLWCGDNEKAEIIIKETAKQNGCYIYCPNHSDIEIKVCDLNGTVFNYKKHKNIFLPLLSLYQPINAVNAITASEILNNNGFAITKEDILNGIKKSVWHARFEIINANPLIIFDGAHNPQGVSASVKSIKHYFKDKKVNILTGVMSDKDYLFIAKEISSVAKNVYCITPDNPRAFKASEYSDVFKSFGITASPFDSINDALRSATTDCDKTNTPLICLGSLYMYSDVIKILNPEE